MMLLNTILWISFIVVFIYAMAPLALLLNSLLKRRQEILPVHSESRIACVIKAGKDARNAFPVIESILKQEYDNYAIYVVVDEYQSLRSIPEHPSLHFLITDSPLTDDIQRIRFALGKMAEEPEAVLILNTGYLLQQDTLARLNNYLSIGFVAIQGHVTGKAPGTKEESIISTGQAYLDFLYYEAPFLAGASSRTRANGIAIKPWYLRLLLDQADKQSAKDSLADFIHETLVSRGHRIAFTYQAAMKCDGYYSTPEAFPGQKADHNPMNKRKSAFRMFLRGVRERNRNILITGFVNSMPPARVMTAFSFVIIAAGHFLNPLTAWLAAGSLLTYFLHYPATLLLIPPGERIKPILPEIAGYYLSKMTEIFKSGKRDKVISAQ